MRALIVLLFFCSFAEASVLKIRITLHSNSVLIGQSLEKELDLETKYGKLVIPFKDIKKIDLGIHYSLGQKETLKSLTDQLGHENYSIRDKAQRSILGFGKLSLPYLLTKGLDSEAALRATKCYSVIKETYTGTETVGDTIYTEDEILKGYITNWSLKIKQDELDFMDIPYTSINKIASINNGSGKYEILTDTDWLDTGIDLGLKTSIEVKAKGQIELWPAAPNQYTATPKGYNTAGKGGQFLAGALIGKIGEGKQFMLGEHCDMSPVAEGRLYLKIVESPWSNKSQGKYSITVKVKE